MLTRPRGMDGQKDIPQWHNLYLDSYIPLRYKSIYDPCPYGYRIPSHGTYNQFTNPGWIAFSYIGGTLWSFNSGLTWLVTTGDRSSSFVYSGFYSFRRYSIVFNKSNSPAFAFYPDKSIHVSYALQNTAGYSVRCIEECELRF